MVYILKTLLYKYSTPFESKKDMYFLCVLQRKHRPFSKIEGVLCKEYWKVWLQKVIFLVQKMTLQK